MRSLKEGDVVLMKNDILHRHCWLFAHVVHVFPNFYGQVRRVVVRRGLSAGVELERDIHKLCLLEAASLYKMVAF